MTRPKVNQPKQALDSMRVIAVEYLYQVLQIVLDQNSEQLE